MLKKPFPIPYWPDNKDEVWPNLWIGTMKEADRIINRINLGGTSDWAIICVCEHERDETKRPSPTRCLATLDSQARYKATMNSLSRISEEIDRQLAAGKKVLVHCWQGVERSPLSVAWWLRTRQGMSLDEAYAHLRKARPQVEDRRGWLARSARAA